MIEWKPISSAPIQPFDQKNWYMRHSPHLLLWARVPKVGSYRYTKTGKGRWVADDGRIYTPTHWAYVNAPEGT